MITTKRMILRPWRESDLAPFADICADPVVMRFFDSVQTYEQAAVAKPRMDAKLAAEGTCFWALEQAGGAPFIGFCGVKSADPDMPCAPAMEIGWRLARPYWGQGYATEAARAAARYMFDQLGADQLVAFIVPENLPSQAVAARLGMWRDGGGDFDHPRVPVDSHARRHWLYRLNKEELT